MLVLLFTAAACGGAEVTDTDCEDPELVEDRVRFASIVMLGTVTDWDGMQATFEVDEIWRGADTAAVVKIVSEPGRAFKAGERYLVFPSATQDRAVFTDRPCSATVRWDESLAELRPQSVRPPIAAPAQDRDLPWEWLIAALALIGLVAAGRQLLERRRHPTPEWDPHYTLATEDEQDA